jgi:nicotinamidase-related amidase
VNFERILMDIEAQHDFFAPGGSCYTRDASNAARRIYRLFRWARTDNVPVVSTLLRIRRHERGPISDVPHCLEDTEGERKLLRTVLPRRINLGLRNITDVPIDVFDRYQQVIFEKRHTDIFRHAAAERLITDIEAATFVICGAGVAHGIVEAAVGLRYRRFGVILAADAVAEVGDPQEAMAYRRMAAKGVIFATTARIVAAVPHRAAGPGGNRLEMPSARSAG